MSVENLEGIYLTSINSNGDVVLTLIHNLMPRWMNSKKEVGKMNI